MVKENFHSDGWLLINKPQGIESFGVIRKLKFRYSFKKIGFAGTLDPLASGLLLVGINKATKKIPKIHHFFDLTVVNMRKSPYSLYKSYR